MKTKSKIKEEKEMLTKVKNCAKDFWNGVIVSPINWMGEHPLGYLFSVAFVILVQFILIVCKKEESE